MKEIISFNKDWKFYRGNLAPFDDTDGWGGAKARGASFGASKASLDDSKWRAITLPHDFMIEGNYTQKSDNGQEMTAIPEMESVDSRLLAGGSLEGDVVWYRKHFTLSEAEDRSVYICFDGVYRDSYVYVNEYFVGNHKSGYTPFCYDITDFVNLNGENVIAVRVDSRGREGWWYEGGGIYRDVRLEITDGVRLAENGVFVSADVNLSPDEFGELSAELRIETEILNKKFCDSYVRAIHIVYSPEGKKIAEYENSTTIPEWDKGMLVNISELSNVILWDIDSPKIYKLVTKLFCGDTQVDEAVNNFGIRKTEFDVDKGFLLNGRKVQLKGLCCHHDHSGVGIGITKEIVEYRMALMKEMGMNAFRNTHYMPTKDMLDICDRMGILFFDETRRMSTAESDLEALREMVRQGRNHPSVFLYGIGNEEIFVQHRPETVRGTRTMRAEVRKLDKTRPITSAVVCWDGEKRYDHADMYNDVSKVLDVMGFNYCAKAWDDYHQKNPMKPVIITEATSINGTRGCYSTDESKGHYYVYDTDNMTKCKNGAKASKLNDGENMWKYFNERYYLAGIFLWTGMDYRGEPTPLTYPAVYSQFGIFDYCGFKKDSYYYYKSWWTDEKVLHIFPHWNLQEKTGEEITVYCYSNIDEVELFVNGKSYGRKKTEKDWYLSWDRVVYEPGEVKADGYINGEVVKTELIKTTGAAYSIKAESYKTEVNADEIAIVNISVLDKDGNVVPNADNYMSFDVTGGVFIGCGNGNPGDHDSDKVPSRRVFNGLCQLLTRAEKSGEMKIRISSPGLIGAECIIIVN